MKRKPLRQKTASTTLEVWWTSAGKKSCVSGAWLLFSPRSEKKLFTPKWQVLSLGNHMQWLGIAMEVKPRLREFKRPATLYICRESDMSSTPLWLKWHKTLQWLRRAMDTWQPSRLQLGSYSGPHKYLVLACISNVLARVRKLPCKKHICLQNRNGRHGLSVPSMQPNRTVTSIDLPTSFPCQPEAASLRIISWKAANVPKTAQRPLWLLNPAHALKLPRSMMPPLT